MDDEHCPCHDCQHQYRHAGYHHDPVHGLHAPDSASDPFQQALQIKFINRNTDKLVGNVPFSVTVTDPDGKSAIWSDDDMDGIIHKTEP